MRVFTFVFTWTLQLMLNAPTTPSTIELAKSQYQHVQQLAQRLIDAKLINVPKDTFANILIEIAWCESHCNTKAVSGTQQGILQWTKGTRAYLGMPADITQDDWERQLEYVFLTYSKVRYQSYYCKSRSDFYALNAAPSRAHKFTLAKDDALYQAYKHLDIDEDGAFTKNDLEVRISKLTRYKKFITLKQKMRE